MHDARPPRSANSLTWLAVLWLACAAGCAALRPTAPGTPPAEVDVPTAVERVEEARNQGQCDQAVAHWKAGRSDAAQRLVEQVLARNPRHGHARRLQADLALAAGNEQAAEQLLVALLADDPQDQAAIAGLACLYESQGRDSEAEHLFAQLDAGAPAP
jgi:predicted Zn-dependent protease